MSLALWVFGIPSFLACYSSDQIEHFRGALKPEKTFVNGVIAVISLTDFRSPWSMRAFCRNFCSKDPSGISFLNPCC